jgi:TolB-like protein
VTGPSRAVFLSYASQDAEAAQQLCNALRAAGVEVWFDQSELRGGDAWDALIRRRIKGCYLFVPIISANTQSREEGYFRREWNLAAARTLDMAEGRAFLLPIVIDGTSDSQAIVPEKFREVQWTRLPAGANTDALVDHVRQLLSPDATMPMATSARSSALPTSPPGAGLLRLTRSREWRWAGAGLVAVGLAVIAFWTLPRFWKAAPAPAPPAMSVAIVPFAAPHGDADASRIADALARDLVTRLGRVEGIEGRVSVISGLSFPAGEMGTIGPRELGRKLEARYLVEGDVLHGSDGNTVNLRLVNTTTGAQVWSERGSLPDSDVTKDSSVSLYNLSNRLRQAIVSAEIRRIEGLPVAALSARELVLRANVMSYDNPTLARLSEARKLIDEALRLEPDLEPAMIAGAINTGSIQEVDPHPDHDRIARDLDYFSDRAVHLEPSDPGAWHVRTDALVNLGRWDAALQASEERIRIAPSDPNSYVLRADVMTSMGRPDEALKLIDRVFAMNPPNRGYPLRTACQAHLLAGQANQAIATCEKLGSRDLLWYARMAAAYANNGDMEKAAAARAELLRTVPGYTISQLRAKRYSDHPEYVKLAERYWYAGLRRAGFQEN